MKVEKISIENFRNISGLSLEPGPAANIICADNAQGKTNLLEALWMFSGAKSFRGAKETEMIRRGEDMAFLDLTFHAGGRSQNAQLRYAADNKKQVVLGGVKLKRSGELSGEFCAVVFSPDHLWMVKHGPEKRRRMLDTGLNQIYPKYRKVLESYERILRQRAFLIRDARRHIDLFDTLEAWDSHLIEYGAYITNMRLRYVDRMEQEAGLVYQGIAGGKEALSLSYRPSFLEEGQTALDLDREACKELLGKAVKRARNEDLRLGATTIGPHRDDLLIQVNDLPARTYASQGQQRSCVLAMKLAECHLLAGAAGENPVVLLDDVMSELDESRREYLLNHLEDKQVFITCCDDSAYSGLRDGRVFRMREGAIFYND